MLRVNLKPEKLPQIRDGVSYSPDFDFDLWGVDFHRPRIPMDPKDWGNRWMVPKPGKAVMQRKTLPMRVTKKAKTFLKLFHQKFLQVEKNWVVSFGHVK